MKKLKLIIYLLLLSMIPFFVIKSIFNNVLDVAVVRVNYYSLKAAEHAKVDTILVQRGDKVIKGQLILTMTSDELSNELIVINNSINSMKNNYQIKLASLRSDLLIAQKNSIFEHDQLNKYRQYFKEGAVSLIMLDGANQNYIKSLFNAESIKNSIIQAKQDYDLSLSQLLQQKAILEAKISSLKNMLILQEKLILYLYRLDKM